MIKIPRVSDQLTPIHSHEKKPSGSITGLSSSMLSKQKIDNSHMILSEISNNRIHELFHQELFTIKQFWEDLGVSENFKKLFIVCSSEMDNSHIKNYFDLEIKYLRSLSESLKVILLYNNSLYFNL